MFPTDARLRQELDLLVESLAVLLAEMGCANVPGRDWRSTEYTACDDPTLPRTEPYREADT